MRTCGHLLSSTLSFLTLHTERAFRTTGLFSGVRISLAPSVPRSLPQSSLETPAHSHILLAHLPLSHYSVYEPPRLYTLANCWPTLLLLVWAPLVIDTHTFHNYFFPLAHFFLLPKGNIINSSSTPPCCLSRLVYDAGNEIPIVQIIVKGNLGITVFLLHSLTPVMHRATIIPRAANNV